ncbi:MAG: hypothetical protein ACFFE6_01540 [Candidatus Thorarchaeota archaeon]
MALELPHLQLLRILMGVTVLLSCIFFVRSKKSSKKKRVISLTVFFLIFVLSLYLYIIL